MKSFLGNFYRHLAIFFWSHWFCSSLIWLVIGMSCGFPPMQKGGSLISRMRCSSLFWKQKLGSAHFISFSSKSNGVPQNVIIELYGKKRKGEWRRYFLGLVNCHANLRINVWSNNRLILLTLKKNKSLAPSTSNFFAMDKIEEVGPPYFSFKCLRHASFAKISMQDGCCPDVCLALTIQFYCFNSPIREMKWSWVLG